MRAITTTTRGLGVLFLMSKDRFGGLAAVAAALVAGAWFASFGLR